jgi:hypothetical protein
MEKDEVGVSEEIVINIVRFVLLSRQEANTGTRDAIQTARATPLLASFC